MKWPRAALAARPAGHIFIGRFSSLAELAPNPQHTQIGECGEKHQDTDGQADARIGKSKIDSVMGRRGIPDQEGDDGAEGCREEGRKAECKTH